MTSYSVIDKSARCPIVRGLIPQIVGALPPFVAQLLQDHPRLVLAGGAIRDTLIGAEPQDYDLVVAWPGFVYPQDDVDQLMERGRSGVIRLVEDTTFAHTGPEIGARPHIITETDRAFTLHWHPAVGKRAPVQLLRRAFESAPAALDSFDYSVTQAALYWYPGHSPADRYKGTRAESVLGAIYTDTVEPGWYLQLSEQYLADLMARRLRFVGGGLGTADASAVRGLKLMGRGQGCPGRGGQAPRRLDGHQHHGRLRRPPPRPGPAQHPGGPAIRGGPPGRGGGAWADRVRGRLAGFGRVLIGPIAIPLP